MKSALRVLSICLLPLLCFGLDENVINDFIEHCQRADLENVLKTINSLKDYREIKALIDHVDEEGHRPLYHVVGGRSQRYNSNGVVGDAETRIDIVRILAFLGADPNAVQQDDDRFNGPLHAIVQLQDEEMLKAFLSAFFLSLRPNLKSGENISPLHLASSHPNIEIIDQLLRFVQIDPTVKDDNGYTPLDCAFLTLPLALFKEVLKLHIRYGFGHLKGVFATAPDLELIRLDEILDRYADDLKGEVTIKKILKKNKKAIREAKKYVMRKAKRLYKKPCETTRGMAEKINFLIRAGDDFSDFKAVEEIVHVDIGRIDLFSNKRWERLDEFLKNAIIYCNLSAIIKIKNAWSTWSLNIHFGRPSMLSTAIKSDRQGIIIEELLLYDNRRSSPPALPPKITPGAKFSMIPGSLGTVRLQKPLPQDDTRSQALIEAFKEKNFNAFRILGRIYGVDLTVTKSSEESKYNLLSYGLNEYKKHGKCGLLLFKLLPDVLLTNGYYDAFTMVLPDDVMRSVIKTRNAGMLSVMEKRYGRDAFHAMLNTALHTYLKDSTEIDDMMQFLLADASVRRWAMRDIRICKVPRFFQMSEPLIERYIDELDLRDRRDFAGFNCKDYLRNRRNIAINDKNKIKNVFDRLPDGLLSDQSDNHARFITEMPRVEDLRDIPVELKKAIITHLYMTTIYNQSKYGERFYQVLEIDRNSGLSLGQSELYAMINGAMNMLCKDEIIEKLILTYHQIISLEKLKQVMKRIKGSDVLTLILSNKELEWENKSLRSLKRKPDGDLTEENPSKRSRPNGYDFTL